MMTGRVHAVISCALLSGAVGLQWSGVVCDFPCVWAAAPYCSYSLVASKFQPRPVPNHASATTSFPAMLAWVVHAWVGTLHLFS
jgi:hypothetical protein